MLGTFALSVGAAVSQILSTNNREKDSDTSNQLVLIGYENIII